jgi:hypothetical protein
MGCARTATAPVRGCRLWLATMRWLGNQCGEGAGGQALRRQGRGRWGGVDGVGRAAGRAGPRGDLTASRSKSWGAQPPWGAGWGAAARDRWGRHYWGSGGTAAGRSWEGAAAGGSWCTGRSSRARSWGSWFRGGAGSWSVATSGSHSRRRGGLEKSAMEVGRACWRLGTTRVRVRVWVLFSFSTISCSYTAARL